MISKGEGGGRGFSVKMLPVRLRRVICIELISTICEKKSFSRSQSQTRT